jgi:hypothetical protein
MMASKEETDFPADMLIPISHAIGIAVLFAIVAAVMWGLR